jgi:3-methyladenine DNA glycosylase AlkD
MAAADEIEARLRAVGTPERAEGEKRYLKSSLDFLGVRVPDVRREVRAVARTIDSHDELVSLVEDLWSAPVHERRLAVALLLDNRADLLGPTDLPLIERLVRESKTWALVDVLAGNVLGQILLAHPEAADAMDRWATDDDFWIRRSALLSQGRPLKAGAPFDRFARHADSMLDEREFFIRKAIGWVLRDVSKTRPEEVFEWLLPRASRASGVTMREAVKYLSPEQRRALGR